MKTDQVEKPILEELKGREISAVTFVRDYLQLQFDGPFINFFVWPQVLQGRTMFDFNRLGYRDVLCELIGKTVGGVIERREEKLQLFLTDGSLVEVSLLLKDRRGPEAVLFQNGKGGFGVW